MWNQILEWVEGIWESIKTNNSKDWTSFFQGVVHTLTLLLAPTMLFCEAIFKSKGLSEFISYYGLWIVCISQFILFLIYFFNKSKKQ